jgi:ABC-type uncharacterized transport system permease subunit
MTAELLVGAGAVALYGSAALLAIVAAMRPDGPARLAEPALPWSAATGAACLGAGLVLHGLHTGVFPAFGAFRAASWYAIALTAAYLGVSRRHGLRTLGAALFPYLTVLILLGLPQIAASPVVPGNTGTALLGLHVVTAFLGYGLFTLESAVAAAYLWQDRSLKRREFGGLCRKLPALETLDRIMFELIGPAFVLFTISIALGVGLAHANRWGARWTTDPKVLATGFTWLVYGLLFHLRRGADRHGGKVAWVAVLGFASLLVAFVGVHWLTHSMHSFGFLDS